MRYSCVICTYEPKLDLLLDAVWSAHDLFDEIVIVDDGSINSNPVGVYAGYVNKDGTTPPKRFFRHETNKGLWAARNTGIGEAKGDIIALLDDDDYFNRDGVIKLKEFIEAQEKTRESLFEQDTLCDVHVDVWHFKLKEFGESNGEYNGGGDPNELPYRSSIPGISWFRKSVWEDVGGYKNVEAEDWNFWLRAFKAGKKFQYFDRVVYNMNVRSDSRSHHWKMPYEEIKRQVLDNA